MKLCVYTSLSEKRLQFFKWVNCSLTIWFHKFKLYNLYSYCLFIISFQTVYTNFSKKLDVLHTQCLIKKLNAFESFQNVLIWQVELVRCLISVLHCFLVFINNLCSVLNMVIFFCFRMTWKSSISVGKVINDLNYKLNNEPLQSVTHINNLRVTFDTWQNSFSGSRWKYQIRCC